MGVHRGRRVAWVCVVGAAEAFERTAPAPDHNGRTLRYTIGSARCGEGRGAERDVEAVAPDRHAGEPRQVRVLGDEVVLATLVTLEPAQVDLPAGVEYLPAGLAAADRRVAEPHLEHRPVAGVRAVQAS